MGPSLWIVLVVICIPYSGASDLTREVLVRKELMVERRMLARGLDAVREDGAGHLLFD